MVDIDALKGKIKESGMTTVAICEKSGILKQTFYNRLKDPNFTVDEVSGLKSALSLTEPEVRKIFFAKKLD